MKDDPIVISNWSIDNPIVKQSDLGWRERDYQDAGSDNPEKVFNYHWKHFFSIVFYYPAKGSFYELFMEGYPFKFWKVKTRDKWDGKWISQQIAWNSHEEGEVLFTFDDDTDLWNALKIDKKTIGEVLANSLILEIN